MESKSLISSSIPLIEESYAYGVVEHPFPLNCLLREWYLGSDFYQAVKIGIVQYVCILLSQFSFNVSYFIILRYLFFSKYLFQMMLKPICSLLAIFFNIFGVYGEGMFEWRYA